MDILQFRYSPINKVIGQGEEKYLLKNAAMIQIQIETLDIESMVGHFWSVFE